MRVPPPQQIATYLIIYRVADGTAWAKDKVESRTLTSMHARTDVSDFGKHRHAPTDDVQFTSEFSVSDVLESKVGVETTQSAAHGVAV